MSVASLNPRKTVPGFLATKNTGRKLSMVTAYDYTLARLVDSAGVDAILVGDSLGMVMQGSDNPLSVTMDEMVYHTRCVARGTRSALLVADLPFLSYQASVTEAIHNAGRFLKEAGAQCVKLEGGRRCAATIAAIVQCDIPVMGHIGLTPQSVHAFGGFKVQRGFEQIMEDARAVQEAGAFAVVIECVPASLASRITQELKIPTIGIGAGVNCDGQVLVGQDLLGMFDGIRPKFVKRYVELGETIRQAVQSFHSEVQAGIRLKTKPASPGFAKR
jgi:3-methyl-2-oxobutanoate hydroxymethyltransferase